MSKILKNTTSSDIEVFNLGRTIPANDQLNLDTSDFIRLASDDVVSELNTLINSGDIVVNDGTNDLIIEDALEYIKFPDFAKAIRFDNSENGFISDNVKNAIEESKFDGTIFNGIDAGIFRTDRILNAYNATGGQVINSSSPTTIQVDTAGSASDTAVFLISSGEIEFLESGKYNIFYYVAFDNNNNSRTNTQSFLELNTGSGFSKITGSDVFTYERTSNADRQTGSNVVSLDMNSGNIIRIRSQIIQGSNNTTFAESCKIQIIPFDSATEESNFTIDGSNLTETEILGQIDAGEL